MGIFGLSRNHIAIVGIVVTMGVVLAFDVYTTQSSNNALHELREAQRVSDTYAELQVRIVEAESAFYQAVAFPSLEAYANLKSALDDALLQGVFLRSVSREEAARLRETFGNFEGLRVALNETVTSGGDLRAVYDGVLDGTGLVDDMVSATAEGAAVRKAEADEMARSFERSQDIRLFVVFGVNGLGLIMIAWLAVAVRGFSRREAEMHSLAEANRLLEQSNEATARANRAKSEFLSRMSHELRSPLHAVLGFGQLLQMDELTPDQRESVDYILSSGRHLLRLIDEVLDISRIEAGRMNLSIEPFALDTLASEVAEMVRPLAMDAGVEIEVRAASGVDHALGDVQRAKQALLNLFSNAIKYNHRGGRVTASVEAGDGRRVQVRVIDTGPGIPTDKIGRLFEPFDRLDAEKTGVEGTGLGLALSRALVEAMNGSLTVESEPAVGSTFSIVLPAAADVVAHEPGREPSPTSENPVTVLYVEDNLANLSLVERALSQRANVRILAARTGMDGIALAREASPDIVMLDYHLPDMSGLDVIEVLKAGDQTAGLPVVLLSASTSSRLADQALAAGAVAMLSKPVDLAELFAVFAEVIAAAPAAAA